MNNMLPFVVPDSLKTLKMSEKNGVIRQLVRSFLISGLASTDYTLLLQAYAQINAPPLPTPGSFLTAPALAPNGNTAPFAMLVLSGREFNQVEDKNTVECVLTFEHFLEADNQVIGGGLPIQSVNGWNVPSSIQTFGRNRASVQQLKTNFVPYIYIVNPDLDALPIPDGFPNITNLGIAPPVWDNATAYTAGQPVMYGGVYWVAVVDIPAPVPPLVLNPHPPGGAGVLIGQVWRQAVVGEDILQQTAPAGQQGTQIALAHQFPNDTTIEKDVPGQTIFQTGEVTIFQPNENFKLHGQVFIANPRSIKVALTGAINSVPWMDGNAFEWMCTEVSWEPLYAPVLAGPPPVNVGQWRMSFEFQHNPDTWLPTAVFNDQRIGRPPPNLIPGLGFQLIQRLPESAGRPGFQSMIDFAAYFLRNFQMIPAE